MERIKINLGRSRTKNKIRCVSEALNMRQIVDLQRQIVQQNNGLIVFDHHGNGDDTLHRAIGPVIRFVQFFNFFPVQNVRSSDVANITFKWISFLTFRSVLAIVLALFEFILYLSEVFISTLSMDHFSAIAFFLINLIGMINFVRVARNWKTIMKCWLNLEEVFLFPPYKRRKYSLRVKLRLVSFVFLFCMFAEHSMYTAQELHFHYMKVKLCNDIKEDMAGHTFTFFKRHIYSNIRFNYFVVFVFELLTVSMVVSWNFLDLFIIIFSIGITERFSQFMERLKSIQNKNMPASFWAECRLHYNQLQKMVNLVNDNFGIIILLVCFNNVYFLCITFYSIVKIEFPFVINQIYFIYSVIYSIGKFMALLFTAAQINEFSTKPHDVVRDIPTESWNSDAERFLMQLQSDTVALTGYKLFYITKKFILGMTGTIITYEMIVIDNITINTALTTTSIC